MDGYYTTGTDYFDAYTQLTWSKIKLNDVVGDTVNCGVALSAGYNSGYVTFQPGEYIVRGIKMVHKGQKFAIRLAELDSSGNYAATVVVGSGGWQGQGGMGTGLMSKNRVSSALNETFKCV